MNPYRVAYCCAPIDGPSLWFSLKVKLRAQKTPLPLGIWPSLDGIYTGYKPRSDADMDTDTVGRSQPGTPLGDRAR